MENFIQNSIYPNLLKTYFKKLHTTEAYTRRGYTNGVYRVSKIALQLCWNSAPLTQNASSNLFDWNFFKLSNLINYLETLILYYDI